MLKKFKQTTLGTLKTSGVFKLVENSRWRQRHLLILAYHGISMNDEHEWDSSLYMTADCFRRRMQLLKDSDCTVLPLDEAIRRLYYQNLPERCVALTFDDGNHDFYPGAWPTLKEFGFPVTVYLSTYYSRYRKPVFDVICSYLLWKGQKGRLDLKPITGQDMVIELSANGSIARAVNELLRFADQQKLSAEAKNALAASVAAQLKIDYQAIVETRVLQLLSPEEVKTLASEGVDIQLHTHRHRVPTERSLFLREIEDNKKSIQAMTGDVPSHFCYPSGVYRPSLLPWLEEAGVVSATTCDVGFASHQSHPLMLPRLLDGSGLSEIEFEGWLTGVSAALPRRRKVG
jgi:peptidoglycan/xylan/chitin deacetylase (PgdA/CDA1 family)